MNFRSSFSDRNFRSEEDIEAVKYTLEQQGRSNSKLNQNKSMLSYGLKSGNKMSGEIFDFSIDEVNNNKNNKLIDIIIDERNKLNYNNNMLEAYKSKYSNSEELKDIINSQLLIIKDMEKDRNIYMKELSDIKVKCNDKINEVMQLNNIIERKEYEIESLELNYSNELDTTKAQLEDIQKNYDKMKDGYNDLLYNKNSLNNSLSEKNTDFEKLSNNYNNLIKNYNDAISNYQELKLKFDELIEVNENNNDNYFKTIHYNNINIAEKSTSLINLTDQLECSIEKNATQELELNRLKSNISNQEITMKKLTTKYQLLEDDHKRVLFDNKNNLNNLEEEIKKLKNYNSNNSNEILNYKNIINNLENDNFNLNNNYTSEKNDNNILKLKIEKLETLLKSKDQELSLVRDNFATLSEGLRNVVSDKEMSENRFNKTCSALQKELKDLNFLSKSDRNKLNDFNSFHKENLKLIRDHIVGLYNNLKTGGNNNNDSLSTNSLRWKLSDNNKSKSNFLNSSVDNESFSLFLESICDSCDDIFLIITEHKSKISNYERQLSDLRNKDRQHLAQSTDIIDLIKTFYENFLISEIDEDFNTIRIGKNYFEEFKKTYRSTIKDSQNSDYFEIIKVEINNLMNLLINSKRDCTNKTSLLRSYDKKTSTLESLNTLNIDKINSLQDNLDNLYTKCMDIYKFSSRIDSKSNNSPNNNDHDKLHFLQSNTFSTRNFNGAFKETIMGSPIFKPFDETINFISSPGNPSDNVFEEKTLFRQTKEFDKSILHLSDLVDESKSILANTHKLMNIRLKDLEDRNYNYENFIERIRDLINEINIKLNVKVSMNNSGDNGDKLLQKLNDIINNLIDIINPLSKSYIDLISINSILESHYKENANNQTESITLILKKVLNNYRNDIINLEDSLRLNNDKMSEIILNSNNLNKNYKDLMIKSKSVKDKLNNLIITTLFDRYIILNKFPLYVTSRSLIFEAADSDSYDSNGKNNKVIIKMISDRQIYSKILKCHKEANFDSNFVVPVLSHYTPNNYKSNEKTLEDIGVLSNSTLSEVLTKQVEISYVVVLPSAEHNLDSCLHCEIISGYNYDLIKNIFSQLVVAVNHVHEKGFVHGSIRSDHCLKYGSTWRLTGISDICLMGNDVVSANSGTSCLPPEYFIEVDRKKSLLALRTIKSLSENHIDLSEALIAHTTIDMWGLGCILYQLSNSSGKPLFFSGNSSEKNISTDIYDDDNIWKLIDWSNITKDRKLLLVKNPYARNLISRLLYKSPEQRPLSLNDVLNHPFLSNGGHSRPDGYKYDIYISFKKNPSSVHYMESLYQNLKDNGLSVARSGEENCLDALFSSRYFVCFITNDLFTNLEDKSINDINIILEHRIALELKGLMLIEDIWPVLVGDQISSHPLTFSKYKWDIKATTNKIPYIDQKLNFYLDKFSLGCPLVSHRSIHSLMTAIKSLKSIGAIHGDVFVSMRNIVSTIRSLNNERTNFNFTSSNRIVSNSFSIGDENDEINVSSDLNNNHNEDFIHKSIVYDLEKKLIVNEKYLSELETVLNKLRKVPFEAYKVIIKMEDILSKYRERNQPLDKYLDQLKKDILKNIKEMKKIFIDFN